MDTTPRAGQSVYRIEGMFLNEPHLSLQRTKPACGCDIPLGGVWTFAASRTLEDGREETYCRKCLRVGGRWTPA